MAAECISIGAGQQHRREAVDYILKAVSLETFRADLDQDAVLAQAALQRRIDRAGLSGAQHNKQLVKTNYFFLTDIGQALEATIRQTWTGTPRSKYPPHFGNDTIWFPNPEQWLAHYMNTVFIVPPSNSELGTVSYLDQRFTISGHIKSESSREVKRPLPVWIIGERYPVPENSDAASKSYIDMSYWSGSPGYYEYLALVPKAHTETITVKKGSQPEPRNVSTLESSEFIVAHIATRKRLQPSDRLPTAEEVRKAYDPATRSFGFAQFRSDAESGSHIHAVSFNEVWLAVSDDCMQVYNVSQYLAALMAGFDALNALDTCIDGLRDARQKAMA